MAKSWGFEPRQTRFRELAFQGQLCDSGQGDGASGSSWVRMEKHLWPEVAVETKYSSVSAY